VPVTSLEELARAVPRGRRLLGLDVGAKTIGLALSDVGLTIATPMRTLARSTFAKDAARLAAIAAEHEVGGLVIGLPLNMDGSEGPRAQSVRQFGENVAARVALPIAFWDERLSTAAVERMMIEADYSRRKRAALVDGMAAAYILQGALDRMRAAGSA